MRDTGISLLTDEALFQACGVAFAFAGRGGGVSEGAYASLNTADHVGDEARAVEENRRRLLACIGASGASLIAPNQVHGDRVVLASLGPEERRIGATPQIAAPQLAALQDGENGLSMHGMCRRGFMANWGYSPNRRPPGRRAPNHWRSQQGN